MDHPAGNHHSCSARCPSIFLLTLFQSADEVQLPARMPLIAGFGIIAITTPAEPPRAPISPMPDRASKSHLLTRRESGHMPLQARLNVRGAMRHTLVRGIHKSAFLGEEDKTKFTAEVTACTRPDYQEGEGKCEG